MEEPLNSIKQQERSFKDLLADEIISKLMELQGECKIKKIIYLRINYLKSFFLMVILTLSVVGLILLKYSVKIRTMVFYSVIPYDELKAATHIYVQGIEGEQEISKVSKISHCGIVRSLFEYKKLKYEIFQEKHLPLGLPYIQKLRESLRDFFLKSGLSSEEAKRMEQLYGKNQHKVQVPGYFQYIFDTMTQPFFLFQYFVSLIYIIQGYTIYGFVLIVFSVFTTSINYILLNRSYNKIKETAERIFRVKVLRNGVFQEVNNVDIVPGDLYEPGQEICCDSIVVKGQLFVDEVNLTGENVPIAKFKISDCSKHSDKNHWIFQGSKVETMKENTLALAVNVGYTSQRGRILRRILNKTPHQPQFFLKLIYFQLEVLAVGCILYILSLIKLFTLDIDPIMVVFRFCDFITYSFPAAFPIFFNLAYSLCLVRLNRQNIIGTQAEKTVESSRMKTICFDKTGTLTMNKMEVSNIYAFAQGQTTQITTKVHENHLVSYLFAACNSVEVINGEVKGDQIDLRMFDFVQAKLFPTKSAEIARQVSVNNQQIQIIKIHQYESQFQSMSVLVREPKSGRHFVFVKGSPEMIHDYSLQKVHGFENLIKKLSFSGFRSIGFGYKEVKESEIEKYMTMCREEFLSNTNIMGVVSFANRLKADALSTVQTLLENDISTKIITGDNIFLGVQTAVAVGMIPSQAKITVIEGKKYCKTTNTAHVLHLFNKQYGNLDEKAETIQNFTFEVDANHFYAIDNDFIKQNPLSFLHDRIKVFARISPENKGLIVRRHVEQIAQQKASLTFRQRIFQDCSLKVGMVGDGANDLIAIKEAHVGIGISSSDAVFSASFAVKDLQQILQIIKESKNAQQQIIQMARYYGLTQFISMVAAIILSMDASFFSSLQISYKSFIIQLSMTLLFALSKPAKSMTKHLNNTNLLDRENHLVYWITVITYSVGLVLAYTYYANSQDFQPNPHQEIHFDVGWYGYAKSSTVSFFMTCIAYISLPFAIYKGSPWKLPIWKNIPMIVLIFANVIILLPTSMLTENLDFLGLQAINQKEMAIIWGIMLLTSLAAVLLNRLIEKFFFSKRQSEIETHQTICQK